MENDLNKIIHQAKQATAEAIFCERMEEQDKTHQFGITYLTRQVPYWTRIYLKKNQPRNYFRVTKTVPPGFEERPFFWVCKFQVWAKGKLAIDERITAEAYHFYAQLAEWNEQDGFPEFFIYTPHLV